MKFNPTVTTGELLHLLVLIVGITSAYYALRADWTIMASTIARHDQILNRLIENESQLAINQAKVGAALEGVNKLLEEHMRTTVKP